jgi:transcriptional regulator with XRE-family HTH domain
MTWKIRLKKARENKGLNKTQFARAMEVSNPTVTDWESENDGIENISGENLMKICRILEIDADWLLYGTEKPSPPALYLVKKSEDLGDEYIKLMQLYSASTPIARRLIMDSAMDADKIAAGDLAVDKPE